MILGAPEGTDMTGQKYFAFLAVMVGAAAIAVPSAGQQADTPTFRSGVQLVEVDVIVTDGEGKPVRDLALEDFEIVEDGRPQLVRTFSSVDLPREADQRQPLGRLTVESDITTNTMAEGRTYVLLLDAGPVGDIGLKARHLAERWLDEVVTPNDRVAVIHVQGSFTHAQPFTNSKRLILDSINRALTGGSAAASIGGPVKRNLDSWRAIREISERLGTISGRRKAIVWVVNPAPILDPAAYMTIGSSPHPVVNAAMDLLAAWRDAARAAVNNNVAVYPVDPRGLTTELGLGPLVDLASFREVAEETGGVPIGVNTNNFSDGFAAIVQDLNTYYLLGYTPEPEHTDGKFHPVQVRVKRPGVTVRARRGYYAPSATALPPKELPAPPEGVSLAARDALRRPIETQGLGIDVSAVSFRGNGKDIPVVITAHVNGQKLEFDAGQRLAVSYQVFDLEGKVVTGFYKVFGFNLGSESRARATGTGLQFVERITLKPGRYELRLVAEQPGGPLGSVNAPIDAAKFDGDLEMSGVALASRRAPEVLLVGDRTLRSALPADATALRSFRGSGGFSAYAEVYTKLDSAIPATRFAGIRFATLRAGISTMDGVVVAQGQTQRLSVEESGKMVREGFRTDFDLSRLAPGRYLIALEASTTGDRKKTISRQIPFAVE